MKAHGRERPAVSGQLARDRDGDDRAPLAALLERLPASVQTERARISAGTDGGRLPLAADAGARPPRPAGGGPCVLPVLVLAPWRRRSPLESSLGVSPRKGPNDCGRKRDQSPSSTVSASAVSVVLIGATGCLGAMCSAQNRIRAPHTLMTSSASPPGPGHSDELAAAAAVRRRGIGLVDGATVITDHLGHIVGGVPASG